MNTKQASASTSTTRSDKLNPGDEAAPGTPGTGEDLCPVCDGSGKVDASDCVNCGGTGRVIHGVGGA